MKRFLLLMVVLTLALSCIGCIDTGTEYNAHYIPADLAPINIEVITEEIERSSMPDGGYRFANAEYREQRSAYATYYIREAKRSSGLLSNDDTLSDEAKMALINKYLDTPELEITDLYCTLMLVDKESITDKMKKSISDYLVSLYDENEGCFTLINNSDSDNNTDSLYPTFIAYSIALSLDIEPKPINDWLEKTTKEYFAHGEIKESNSSAYVMLLQLSIECGLKLPDESIESVFYMFENSIDNMDMLVNSTEIYLPVYLMDYLEYCTLSNSNSKLRYKQITDAICDENGLKDSILMDNDVYGLHAAMRALELSEYSFNTDSTIDVVFDEFDRFKLHDSTYINPGYVESNFVDTYYADAIIHMLNISADNDIVTYCEMNRSTIFENGAINIYYYLELLQRNDLLFVINNDKQRIVNELLTTLHSALSETTGTITLRLSTLNATLKSLNILGVEWSISEDEAKSIIDSFGENENKQQFVYDLAELVDFINLLNKDDSENIEFYCFKLENELIALTDSDVSNKTMLYSKAVNLFAECGYDLTDELLQHIKRTVTQAQDISGLYKGGDSIADVISFRSTYDAIILHRAIS